MDYEHGPHRRLAYGAHPDQHLVITYPRDLRVRGTAVLVHGGYWRERITAEVMAPMLEHLAARGWLVVNVEYRRGPGHPWPIPCRDVARALELAREHAAGSAVVVIGHSVGGQLALLTANQADAVVALAPVTDAVRVHDEGLGESAAIKYFGQAPRQLPGIYADASPITHPAPRVPVLLMHGADDDRVPLDHSRDYLQARPLATGSTTHCPDELDHFRIIDPCNPHWERVDDWIDAVPADPAPTPSIR